MKWQPASFSEPETCLKCKHIPICQPNLDYLKLCKITGFKFTAQKRKDFMKESQIKV